MRTQFRHDQIRGKVKEDVADVEQGQASRYLLWRQVQLRSQVVPLLLVHGLCQADIRPDGRTYEIKSPER